MDCFFPLQRVDKTKPLNSALMELKVVDDYIGNYMASNRSQCVLEI